MVAIIEGPLLDVPICPPTSPIVVIDRTRPRLTDFIDSAVSDTENIELTWSNHLKWHSPDDLVAMSISALLVSLHVLAVGLLGNTKTFIRSLRETMSSNSYSTGAWLNWRQSWIPRDSVPPTHFFDLSSINLLIHMHTVVPVVS